MNDRLQVPHFDNESDEANWWFENQDKVAAAFDAAAKNGTLRRGQIKERLEEAKVRAQSVTLHADDVALARDLAEKRGETYEAFVRRVVHEALQLEKSA